MEPFMLSANKLPKSTLNKTLEKRNMGSKPTILPFLKKNLKSGHYLNAAQL